MYILECDDGSYYTGSTTDLENRLREHPRKTGTGLELSQEKSTNELIKRGFPEPNEGDADTTKAAGGANYRD